MIGSVTFGQRTYHQGKGFRMSRRISCFIRGREVLRVEANTGWSMVDWKWDCEVKITFGASST